MNVNNTQTSIHFTILHSSSFIFSSFPPFHYFMDSTYPFHLQQNPYPFHSNWNQFDSIDDIFGQPQLENVLLDHLDGWAIPCTNSNEFKDVKIDDDFFFNCDIGSLYQVSPMIDEMAPSISNAIVTSSDTVVKMEMESPVLVENHNHNSSSSNVIRGRKRSIPLQLEEIRKHFDLPITKAAKEMRVGLTVLKKRCRELNIMRWPHRKIKSLEALINSVKEMGLDEEIVVLENHKRLIEKLPDLELTDRTRKLRQACFKANYKKKRFLAEHSSLC